MKPVLRNCFPCIISCRRQALGNGLYKYNVIEIVAVHDDSLYVIATR
jgi:hypothetical protein